MKKNSYLFIFIIFCGSLYAQSIYSGNLSVASEYYFSDFEGGSGYSLGGCNAFPIGTFVNVKLPYSDDSVNVKIVSRIPEDGIFILVDKSAGDQLYLTKDDILPVRIKVVDFVPPVIADLDEDLDPEPEIKGLTAEAVKESEIPVVESEEVDESEDLVDSIEPVVTDEVITEDVVEAETIDTDAIDDESIIITDESTAEEFLIEDEIIITDDDVVSMDEIEIDEVTPEDEAVIESEDEVIPEDEVATIDEVVVDEVVVDEVVVDEVVPEDEAVIESEDEVVPEDEVATIDETVVDEVAVEEVTVDEVTVDEVAVDEVAVDEVAVGEVAVGEVVKEDVKIEDEPVLTTEEVTEILEHELSIYEDELPVDSMFTNEMEMDLTSTEGTSLDNSETVTTGEDMEPFTEIPESNKKVKRVFYLEPANSKPPEGGVADKDLIPVTKVDNKDFENGYYLQVGIYKNSDLVLKDTEKLEKLNFPYITVKEDSGEERERVLVGPVSNDELGVIMATLQTRGFKNFFRYKKLDKDK